MKKWGWKKMKTVEQDLEFVGLTDEKLRPRELSPSLRAIILEEGGRASLDFFTSLHGERPKGTIGYEVFIITPGHKGETKYVAIEGHVNEEGFLVDGKGNPVSLPSRELELVSVDPYRIIRK